MGILTKEVEVKPTGKMIQYYKDKGYDARYKQPLVVKVEDLSDGSEILIDVLCDYCKETICHPPYKDYYKRIKKFEKFACCKCKSIHQKTTCVANYGVDAPAKSKKVRERMAQTSLQKYGCSNPMQSLEVRAKVNESLCKNGNQKTSKQQRYLHSLLGGELNYFAKYYAIDICFPEEKIALEYDGKGHDLRVTLGRLTQEEFDRKELIRDRVIKSEGYKIIRIKSNSDKLPSDTILFQMLTDARSYFSAYPSHSWIEFSIDTSTVRNAENPNGIPYSFGTLRTIKDSDISAIA